ncbi:MAG: hypothetical protein ACKVOA_05310 [Methylophilaceae bacterium]
MSYPWWRYVLQVCLWLIAMALLMGYLSRSRLKSSKAKNGKNLFHPNSTLVIGAVCFVFFAGITILSNVYSNKTTSVWTTATFVSFAVIAVVVIADYFLARHEVSELGINFGKMTGLRGYIKWAELERIEYSYLTQWFKLKSTDGQVARISVLLTGLPEFARLALKNAPASAIDDSTRAFLEEVSKGKPPQLW